jgi:hypothetical protein
MFCLSVALKLLDGKLRIVQTHFEIIGERGKGREGREWQQRGE